MRTILILNTTHLNKVNQLTKMKEISNVAILPAYIRTQRIRPSGGLIQESHQIRVVYILIEPNQQKMAIVGTFGRVAKSPNLLYLSILTRKLYTLTANVVVTVTEALKVKHIKCLRP